MECGSVRRLDRGRIEKIIALDGQAGDWFGKDVSVAGDTLVVGAYLNDDNGLFDLGLSK